MKEVDLEGETFEKEFYILSDDQQTARYILTPKLMERIMEYKQKLNKSISISFTKNRMYCTIPKYKNLFEAPRLTPIDYDSIEANYKPIKLYTDLVEDLDLNTRIWSKK